MTAQDKINEVAERAARSSNSLALAIRDAVPQITRRLPAFMPPATAERYAAIAMSTVQANPGLRQCTQASIVRGVIRASEYGLALDGELGHAYLVPYNERGVMVAKFQFGYRGLIELMYRTGMWVSFAGDVVCEGDLFDYRKGSKPFIDHKPALNGRGEQYATYAMVYPVNGGIPTFELLNEEDVLKHRAASKMFAHNPKASIWTTHPKRAWIKSAVRELSKSVAMATERHDIVYKAVNLDERIDRGEIIDSTDELDVTETEETPDGQT